MNTIYELFKDKESLNAIPTDVRIGPKTWLRSKSTQDLKRMMKNIKEVANLLNDFQYHGNPKQQRITDEISRNGGISGIYKLMGTLQSEITRRTNQRRINYQKAVVKAGQSNRLYYSNSGVQDDYDYQLLLKYLD